MCVSYCAQIREGCARNPTQGLTALAGPSPSGATKRKKRWQTCYGTAGPVARRLQVPHLSKLNHASRQFRHREGDHRVWLHCDSENPCQA